MRERYVAAKHPALVEPVTETRCIEAGRATDSLVAQYVLGINHRSVPRHYSTKIGMAFYVVHHMAWMMEHLERALRDEGHLRFEGPLYKPTFFYLTREGYPLGTTCWHVQLEWKGWRRAICADTPPLAICRAALVVAGYATPSETYR